MRMKVTVTSDKGFYDSKHIAVKNIADGGSKIVKVLESMPDQIDGVMQYDWTAIDIQFMP